MCDCFVKVQEWVSGTIYTKASLIWKLHTVGVCIVFHSIIVKLKEHEEFFPVFHSFILELLQTLGENKLYSQSNWNEQLIQ